MNNAVVKVAVRTFNYNGMELPDPGSSLTLDEVRDIYSATFPELTSAAIEGPEFHGEKIVYSFLKSVGTKG
jgi:PRTRC genetic system protein C